MPKLYNITAWKNTGFDTGNIPGSIQALPSQSQTYQAAFLWKNYTNGEIRIDAEWDTIKDTDYIRIGTPPDASYYIVEDITMASAHTAILSLTLDPLMTAGGTSYVQIISGQAERAHESADTIFGNVIGEPWTPTDILRITGQKIYNANSSDGTEPKTQIVIGTANLLDMEGLKAQVATIAETDDGGGGSVVWPEVPRPVIPGSYYIKDPEGDGYIGAILMPAYGIFDLSNSDVQKGVSLARSLGIEGLITNSYEIPTKLLDILNFSAIPGTIQSIAGKSSKITDTLTYTYGSYIPRNKKVYSLYNQFQIVSSASGDTREFDAGDLYVEGQSGPYLYLIVDPSPNGTCYLQPAAFQGSRPPLLQYAAAGIAWFNAGIVYSTASGSAISMANASRAFRTARVTRIRDQAEQEYARQELNVDLLDSGIKGLLNYTGVIDSLLDSTNGYGGLWGAQPGGLLKSAHESAIGAQKLQLKYARQADAENYGTIKYRREMGDRIFEQATKNYIVSPEVAFPISSNISAMIGNAFTLTHTGLSDRDMERLDDFLTAYGYAVDRDLETVDLASRAKFNYIKSSGAQVAAPGIPARITQQIGKMLDSGIRIWHVPPDPQWLKNNPVKEVEP